ncbi:pectate lyase [Alteromonas sp. KUL42]|uniref:pectate lyase family protein n=1 Tax=Alteromonas sp. KUL42 TaxID=2480797 RepID=UPI0010358102|nr:pectate lyase C [Alteromonas sp. KUL42]TAP37655.1 pectate lyase C [Alteromonas sp. KUL42]GEA06088.1 pectate lyase [Alteromonas sp. KUL42]
MKTTKCKKSGVLGLFMQVIFSVFLFLVLPVQANTLAFKGAKGFGKYTVGGNLGEVLVVNSLEDTNKKHVGTLRWAVNQPYPRLVVFSVSGVIDLKSPLDIKHDNLTLAGQTSPKGVVISGAETRVKANQVIIRYLRFRPGDTASQNDALFIRNQKDIIVDHCSLSWANDEVGSFYNNTRFTLQNSILSESLNNAGHSKGQHGYGGIWGGNFASFIENVLVSHTSRNPRVNGWRLNPNYAKEHEFVDIRNNVIANWRSNSGYGGEGGRTNLVANYYKPGPTTKALRFFQLWSTDSEPTLLHVSDNLMHGNSEMSKSNTLGIDVKGNKRGSDAFDTITGTSLSSHPFEAEAIKALGDDTLTALQVWQKLVIDKEVGANKTRSSGEHDPVDARILAQLADNSYLKGNGIIDSTKEVIEWPRYKAYFQTASVAEEQLTPAKWKQLSGL